MNNLFDYQEKKKNPIGIMNLDFSTDLTPYVPAMDKIILDRVENRLGLDPNKLLDFAYQVSGMESDHNPMARNPDSTAKGQYQFTDATFITAKNRLKRIMGELPERIVNAETILDLSPAENAIVRLCFLNILFCSLLISNINLPLLKASSNACFATRTSALLGDVAIFFSNACFKSCTN